jgi:hypothetical protein
MMKTSAVALAAILLTGCSGVQRDPPIQVWDDMKQQPKFHPQGANDLPFLSDGRDARRPPEGTVARGHMVEQTAYFTGMEGELYVGKSPVPLTPALLHQGQLSLVMIKPARARALFLPACRPGSLRI